MAAWSVHSLAPVPSVYPVERYEEANRSKGSFDHGGPVLLRGQEPLVELDGRACLGSEAKVDTTLPFWGLTCGEMGCEVDSMSASHQQLTVVLAPLTLR